MTSAARLTITICSVALVFTAGMVTWGLQERTIEETATVNAPLTAVKIGNDDGDVTLRGVAGANAVTIHRTAVLYRGVPTPGESFSVDQGLLTLSDCGAMCTANYTVEVPMGLTVSGSIDDGALDLSGVGAVQVTADDGTILLTDVLGTVDVQTDNGSITGRRLDGGGVNVTTDNGDVDLTTQSPQDVRVRTTNGRVNVAAAAGRYLVDARSEGGLKDVTLPNDPSGDHRIEVLTDDGAITVRPT